MAVPDYTPCWYDSEEIGAAVIDQTPGAVVQALKACLVTGFSLRAITQIVVSGEIATATCADHGYSSTPGKLLLIAGAPDAGLNGRVQPATVTTNTFTYAAPGVSDGVYTGTISAKRAPLGWSVVAESVDGYRAIFGRTDAQSTVSQLLVDDTKSASTVAAVVAMVEGASDIDTFSGRYPSSGYPYWLRGAADAVVKKWIIAGDARRVFFGCQKSTGAYPMPNFFGDPVALYPGDAGVCMLTTHGSASTNAAGGLTGSSFFDYVPGTDLGSAVVFHRTRVDGSLGALGALCGRGSFGSSGVTGASAAVPIIGDYYVKTATEVRARLPGLFLPQGVTPFADRQIVDAPDIGRKLLAVNVMLSTSGVGQMMLDVTGPWE